MSEWPHAETEQVASPIRNWKPRQTLRINESRIQNKPRPTTFPISNTPLSSYTQPSEMWQSRKRVCHINWLHYLRYVCYVLVVSILLTYLDCCVSALKAGQISHHEALHASRCDCTPSAPNLFALEQLEERIQELDLLLCTSKWPANQDQPWMGHS